MSYQRLVEALLMGQPYFGPALRSMQGSPERHKYFLPLVEAIVRKTGTARMSVLEIGAWGGASAISWATAMKRLDVKGQVTCVDPWSPYFDMEQHKSEHYVEMNRAAETGLIYKLFLHN